MTALRHRTPEYRTYAGGNALDDLSRELTRNGAQAVFLVSTGSLARNERVFSRVTDAIGDRLAATFDGVQQHSPIEVVKAVRDQMLEVGADAVVVLGGGSAIVTARAASVLAGERRPISDLATRRGADGRVVNPKMPAPKLPQWIVASTPTTAYAKSGAAMRDTTTGDRVAVYDPKARARGVFFDPDVIATAPASLVRSAALNALSMAVEGLLATGDDPLAEALLAQGAKELVTFLPQVCDGGTDGHARSRVMMGALLAGQGSDFAGGGLALALSHAIGPRSASPNGVVEAVLLPHTLRFTAAAVPDRVPVVAAALGAPSTTSAEGVSDILQEFLGRLGLKVRLQDQGVDEASLDEAIAHAAGDWAISPRIPRQADAGQLRAIVTDAW
ncbi:iron-containing alcohol dehydrogenase family protein [Streptomyces sp. NPDC001393]